MYSRNPRTLGARSDVCWLGRCCTVDYARSFAVQSRRCKRGFATVSSWLDEVVLVVPLRLSPRTSSQDGRRHTRSKRSNQEGTLSIARWCADRHPSTGCLHFPSLPSFLVRHAQRSRSRSRSVSPDGGNSSDASSSGGSWNDLADNDWARRPDYDPTKDPGAGARHGGGGAGRRQRDVTPEMITSLTPLNDTNVGMKMLRLMGWQPGGGLGARGTGENWTAVPVPFQVSLGHR